MVVTLPAFITGILVGLTGTGAGAILTPLLLLATPFRVVKVIASRLTRRIPERYLTWLFSILYFWLGARQVMG